MRRFSLGKVALVAGFVLAAAFSPLQMSFSVAHAGPSANVWWPSEGAHLSGTQPFKAVLDGVAVEQYEMFWQVDGGAWVWMDTSYTDYPHKEAGVTVASWSWKGSGPYKLNFIARQNGVVVAERAVNIYVDGAGAPVVQPTQSPTQAPQPVVQPVQSVALTVTPPASANIPAASGGNNPLSGLTFYVNKNSPAAAQASQWRASRPGDAQKMDVLANSPTAQWLGGWSGDIQSAVERAVSAARSQGQTAVLVAYNIPQRDCGGYSAGGTNDYKNWIGSLARGIGNNSAVIILEPDALAGITCLSQDDQRTRLELLSSAVSILKSNPNTKVYVDAGHSGWVEPSVMAARLQAANIAKADGFSTNVSNFMWTAEETRYGMELSDKLGGAHFIVDTARNGSGSNGEWCNPWGRTIGQKPTTNTGNSRIDAYLWVKTPGESDGACNGGPSAGGWWADYAVKLVP